MAYNVFGNPVTNFTLEGMPQYQGKTITLRDRANVAFNLKNAHDKDRNARQYVEKLKEQSGPGVSTLCLIYNATGGPITLVNNYNRYGHVGQAPIPVRIENGQWGGFLHVKPGSEAAGSHGGVVYRGVNEGGATCDWMAAWANPWNRASWDNAVYTEIRGSGHFDPSDIWDNYINKYLDNRSNTSRDHNVFNLFSRDTWNGCASSVACGSDTTVILEAIFTLENIEA